MALVQCVDCKSDVSDQAAACPRCARPLARPIPGPPPETDLALIALVLAPLIGAVGCVAWLEGSMLLVAQSNLVMVVVMTIAACAGLAAWDATSMDATWRPASAFFAVLVFFPIGLPVYLFTRRKLAHAIGGMLCLAAFVAAVGFYGKQIYDWRERGRRLFAGVPSAPDRPTRQAPVRNEPFGPIGGFAEQRLRRLAANVSKGDNEKSIMASLGEPTNEEPVENNGKTGVMRSWYAGGFSLTVAFTRGKVYYVSADDMNYGYK